jgi:hypothetical protein
MQITELGQIVSYTYDQFLTGTGGALLATVGGYANDRGFLYVPDDNGGAPVPAPPPVVLLALPLLSPVRRRRGRHGRVAPSARTRMPAGRRATLDALLQRPIRG